MLIDWTGEFDRWWHNIEERQSLDTRSRQIAFTLGTQLEFLQSLKQIPSEESPKFQRVLQSRRYPLWRVSHPFLEGIAIRVIVWFPFAEESDLLVAVLGADKAKMGNVFYDSASRRADIEIEKWIRERSK